MRYGIHIENAIGILRVAELTVESMRNKFLLYRKQVFFFEGLGEKEKVKKKTKKK